MRHFVSYQQRAQFDYALVIYIKIFVDKVHSQQRAKIY